MVDFVLNISLIPQQTDVLIILIQFSISLILAACKYICIDNRHVSYTSFLQVYVLNPKQDLHGLGFDPYKHAPEFRGMPFPQLFSLRKILL